LHAVILTVAIYYMPIEISQVHGDIYPVKRTVSYWYWSLFKYLEIGGASNPQTCAAINRHIYYDTANWNTVSKYYQTAPANYYAKF
jgi:hypothetical protein